MPSPLFQFALQPLDGVQPWGPPHDQSLNWFGLTDGHYWIQAGEHCLFEYSESARSGVGVERFCDYQVVRLYEDVIDLAPYALEPVPDELQRYLALSAATPWNHFWTKWCSFIDAGNRPEEDSTLLDSAGPWMGRRILDSGYLTPSTNIVFWSNQDHVHIQWDNREKLLQGHQAWSTQLGSWQLPREKFIDEVRSFHNRLMEQMAERVAQVAIGALAENIRVDLEGLQREQLTRSQSIEGNLRQATPPTDWPSVIAAIRSLEASAA